MREGEHGGHHFVDADGVMTCKVCGRGVGDYQLSVPDTRVSAYLRLRICVSAFAYLRFCVSEPAFAYLRFAFAYLRFAFRVSAFLRFCICVSAYPAFLRFIPFRLKPELQLVK